MATRERAPSSSGMAPEKQIDAEKQIDGHNGLVLAREQIADIQRSRLLAAMVEMAAERGASSVTVTHVVERAGVSRRTFYELFADREDCFLAALDEGLVRVAARVVSAYERSGRWRERIRASLVELLSFLDEDPGTGRLAIVETLGAGPKALERRGRALSRIVAAVEEGRVEVKGGEGPPPVTAEGVAGAVLSVIHGRMLDGDDRPLIELVNPLMSMVVLPYLGPAAARRELDCPVPKVEVRSTSGGGSNPLKQLDMRLTYRTVRVLFAVAENPGGSNRAVGADAGIIDQGQISKLLSRLEKLGLIVNTGLAPGRGAPRAWRLTEKGREVHGALARQLSDA